MLASIDHGLAEADRGEGQPQEEVGAEQAAEFGKPFTDLAEAKRHKKLECLESGERGEIERHFGVGKRRYSLDCIVTRLKGSSEAMIHPL